MKRLFLQCPFIVLAGCATPQVESDRSPDHSAIQRAAARTEITRPAEKKNTRPTPLVKKRTEGGDEKWRLRGSVPAIEPREICEFDANDLKLDGAERRQFLARCSAQERAARDVQPNPGGPDPQASPAR